MKTRDSPAPPPVHVHVLETTPVHFHMRRSPSRTPQDEMKTGQLKGDGGRPKVRTPWIPPGIVSCRRDTSQAQHPSESWTRHQRDAEEQREELAAVSKNLNVLLREQESIHHLKKSKSQHRAKDVLLRRLVETEIDGVAVGNQLTALKETVDGLTKAKRMSKLHAASLGRQQDLLLEKIGLFDHSNHSLRELLREWSEYERDYLVWSQQKHAVKKRLADTEAENIRLLAKLTNKEKEASKLAEHLGVEKDNVKVTKDLSRILDSTRSHLEAQLRRAEAEKARLADQVQKMQRAHELQQKELQVLQDELQTLRLRREDQEVRQHRETLVLVTEQAERAEETSRQLAQKLQEKLSHALSTSSDWCLRHSEEAATKGQLEEDISALKFQVTELKSQHHSAEEKNRVETEELRNQLRHLTAENASIRRDNQRLQGELTSSEEKFKGLHSEAHQLKSSINKYENLVEKYKKKVQQARLESEESCLKLEMVQKEAREVKVSLEREKEQVRRELTGRVRELETLPDRLRRTEQMLQDAQKQADAHKRRNMENNSALCEVRHKVEQQGAQVEMFQQKNVLQQEDNDILKEKVLNLERRLEDMKVENKAMSQALTMKEAGIGSVQQQLEEKTHECSVLTRQLQQSLDNAQRQVNDSMQRVLAKERLSRSKVSDLQNQLTRAKTELNQLQRSKDEMERRFQSQLQNVKQRLEQSDSINRCLQNYVHFLKTSYGNVFGECFPANCEILPTDQPSSIPKAL